MLKEKNIDLKKVYVAFDKSETFTEQFWKELEKIDVTARLTNLKEDSNAIAVTLKDIQEQGVELSAEQKAALTKYADEYSKLLKEIERVGEKLDYATIASFEIKAEKIAENFWKTLDQILMEIEKQAILAEGASAIVTVQGYVEENDIMLVNGAISALENRNCHASSKNVEGIVEKLVKTNDLATIGKLREQLQGRLAKAKKDCVVTDQSRGQGR